VLDKFRASPRIEIVPVNDDLQEAGWARCLKFADKEWDWIDCVSFELMERRGIRSALTLDRHFRQAGFLPLG
jgi:predicted nucleic acid-binding protein